MHTASDVLASTRNSCITNIMKLKKIGRKIRMVASDRDGDGLGEAAVIASAAESHPLPGNASIWRSESPSHGNRWIEKGYHGVATHG